MGSIFGGGNADPQAWRTMHGNRARGRGAAQPPPPQASAPTVHPVPGVARGAPNSPPRARGTAGTSHTRAADPPPAPVNSPAKQRETGLRMPKAGVPGSQG